MDDVYFASVLVVFTIVGMQTCSGGCSQEEIEACQKPLKGIENPGNIAQQCSAFKETKACMTRVMDACPAGMQELLKSDRDVTEELAKICDDDEAIAHIGDVGSCNSAKLKKCSEMAQSESKQHGCQALEDARACFSDFKKECKSPYIVNVLQKGEKLLDQFEGRCKSKGFPTGGKSNGFPNGEAQPDYNNKANTNASESCDRSKVAKCGGVMGRVSDIQTGCRNFHHMKSCFANFKGCNDDYIQTWMAKEISKYADEEAACKKHGYTVAQQGRPWNTGDHLGPSALAVILSTLWILLR